MNIDHAIIDQQLTGLITRAGSSLRGDEHGRRSAAFAVLCVRALLGLEEGEALDRLTDGAGDAGIDAIDLGDLVDGEITVTVFQAKYKQRTDGDFAFPTNDIEKVARSVRALFDPSLPPFQGDRRLELRVEEIRSLVAEGVYPNVRVVLCSNGRTWDPNGQRAIDLAGGSQVSWEHLGLERLVALLQPLRPVDDTLRLSGRAIDENLGLRVVIGRMAVAELASLFDRHGDRLLEQNIRRFLGARNSVNRQIEETLRDPERRVHFYAFNNGVTLVCDQLKFNTLQAQDHVVPVKNVRVVNGGQTCWTIHRVVSAEPAADWSLAQVLVRVYEVPPEDRDLVHALTVATNSQSPVDAVDLRANDPIQVKLELGLRDLGYTYLRKRGQGAANGKTITPEQAAAAVLAVWRGKPHLARFATHQHFGRLYNEIFTDDLLPQQVVTAVDLVRPQVEHTPADALFSTDYGRFHRGYIAGKLIFAGGAASLDERAAQVAATARLGLLLWRRQLLTAGLQAQAAFFRRGDALTGLDDLEAWTGAQLATTSGSARILLAEVAARAGYQTRADPPAS